MSITFIHNKTSVDRTLKIWDLWDLLKQNFNEITKNDHQAVSKMQFLNSYQFQFI